MFAIDHAATALLVKRRFPSVGITPILISVQVMELAWVALNYLGLERTTTEPTVRTVADIHLTFIGYSHSIVSAVIFALLAWLIIEKIFAQPALGRAVGVGIVSHLFLDLITHARDIALWPGFSSPRLGLGLYNGAPMLAFAIELFYGLLCWWVYRGKMPLLAVIVLGNLANLSLFSGDIAGPEQYFAGHPLTVVTVVFIQIVTTLVLVGVLASQTTISDTRTPEKVMVPQ